MHIGFPEWYNDPRDFHEFAIKTYLEAAKINTTPKRKQKFVPKLLYLPVKDGMIGSWYVALCLSYLLQSGYRRICFFVGSEKLSVGTLHESKDIILASEFQSLTLESVFLHSNKKYSLPLNQVNENYGYLFACLSCVADIESFAVAYVGLDASDTKNDPKEIISYITESACIEDDVCCVFVGDFILEQVHPMMGLYFEIVAKLFARKPKAIEFTTHVGDMLIQVA